MKKIFFSFALVLGLGISVAFADNSTTVPVNEAPATNDSIASVDTVAVITPDTVAPATQPCGK